MGVAGTVVAAVTLGAPAVQAAPAPSSPAQGTLVATCGSDPGDWNGVSVFGSQFHDNDKAKNSSASFFTFGAKTVDWKMTLHWANYGTTDTDAYRVTGPRTVEFNSDLGKGKGDFWRFRLTAVDCDSSGHVTSATADTYIPPIPFVFTAPTTHYGTAAGKPLKVALWRPPTLP
jgi:hypothetical protein